MQWTILSEARRLRVKLIKRVMVEPQRRAAAYERSRLARDLHDGLTQDLYATNLALTQLRDRAPDHLRPELDALIDRHVAMAHEARSLTQARSDHQLTVSAEAFQEALTAVSTRQLDLPPLLDWDPGAPEEMPARLMSDAVFALREMISNAMRHSQGRTMLVLVDADADALCLCVADDGVGAGEPAPSGQGLGNLSARAEHWGGVFSRSSIPGVGTTATGVGTTARWRVPWPDDMPQAHPPSLTSAF
jgi:signal transduction histidine kinase